MRISCIVCGLGIGLALPAAGAPGSGDGRREFDWCAPVVVDPLRRWSDAGTCSQPWPLDAIAAGADVVLMEGHELPEQSPAAVPPGADSCETEPSLASHAGYLRELRARAAARGRSLVVAVKTRFDLVGPVLAARPGFDAKFLLRTDRPWRAVQAFFAEDASPDCAQGGCRLAVGEPSPAGGSERSAALWSRIEASGGPGASASIVYYLDRGRQGKRVYGVTNALARLGDASYRAWRASEARRVLELGGYDLVMLNQKFHQYRPPARRGGGHWVGSATAPDVTALNLLGDTLWTGPPRDYGYAEYIAGWHALAADLRRAGVPYGVVVTLAAWRSNATLDAAENAMIRQVARAARLVLLDGRVRRRNGTFAAVKAELEAAGAQVVAVDGSCGEPGARLGPASPKPVDPSDSPSP